MSTEHEFRAQGCFAWLVIAWVIAVTCLLLIIFVRGPGG